MGNRVLENIEKVKSLQEEVSNHPSCADYKWDTDNHLTVIFPPGDTWGCVNGARIKLDCKRQTLLRALVILEECWNQNYIGAK